jgi:hypothetical protein
MESQTYDLQEEIKELKKTIKEYENKFIPSYIDKNMKEIKDKNSNLQQNYDKLYYLFRQYLVNQKNISEVMNRQVEEIRREY